MILELDKTTKDKILSYELPQYSQIPDVGLYLNQVATYINRYLEPFCGFTISESMISNYVKKKLVPNPIKKQYSRDLICYLLFIALCKNVSTLDDIQILITLQRENGHSVETAYSFFKNEFEAILLSVFGLEKKEEKEKNSNESVEKELLEKLIAAIAHKIYVDTIFSSLRKKTE